MKNLKTVLGIVSLFSAFIMLSLACATTKDTTLPMKYEEVVDISGSKDAIYTKANLVFVDLPALLTKISSLPYSSFYFMI